MRENKTIESRFTVQRLHTDDGGGCLVGCPNLPGRMSDDGTIEEATANGRETKAARNAAAVHEAGRPVPPRGADPSMAYGFKRQLRVPRTLHWRRAEQTPCASVSLYTLVVKLPAQGLGERTAE
jgi:hypothetical protein